MTGRGKQEAPAAKKYVAKSMVIAFLLMIL
jgi:acetyltransferase-like isoleucine patch superfamily enzyme